MSSRDSGERTVHQKSEPAHPEIAEMSSAGELCASLDSRKNLDQHALPVVFGLVAHVPSLL